MNCKQLAALYLELVSMYKDEHPVECEDTFEEKHLFLAEKIKSDSLSKKDFLLIEPIFNYGHIDFHRYLKVKKRFIWF